MDVTGAASTHPVEPASTPQLDLDRLLAVLISLHGSQDMDEIMRTAMGFVMTLGECHAVAGYLTTDSGLRRSPSDQKPDGGLDAQVAALDGIDSRIALTDSAWGWAFALGQIDAQSGYLVIAGEAEPSSEEFFLSKILAEYTSAALTNAELQKRVRVRSAEVCRLYEERNAIRDRLERQRITHEVLTRVASSEQDETGLVRALFELTGRAAAAEDLFGNLLAWAGPGCPDPYPRPHQQRRTELIQDALRHDHPVPDRDRTIVVAHRHGEPLGVLAMRSADAPLDEGDLFALEYAATVLGMQLAHRRGLAEVEGRLRRDLVDDLVSGTDEASAVARSEALGYDLHGLHQVISIRGGPGVSDDELTNAVTRGANAVLGAGWLGARRPGMVVLVAGGQISPDALYHAVADALEGAAVAVGVGGYSSTPTALPRSFEESQHALNVRQRSPTQDGVTSFETLDIYRLIASDSGIDPYIRQWLGGLLDYDRQHRSDLIQTLTRYLDCGGNYAATASALMIHRSTLRYRLHRIHEIGGLDLSDVDQRLNLHIAVRLWNVVGEQGES